MATREETVARILNNIGGENIRAAKMFGEYALYCNEKVVALICDDQLFIKTTPSSTAQLDSKHEAPPYPGAKPHLKVPEARISDYRWLTSLVNAVAHDLPAPKPKKPRR